MDNILWHSVFFWAFAVITCGFAVMVVLSDNIVRMAVALIFSLSGAAGLFLLAGADFVGAMQLMIYVGGTLVLLIFGVMLTAQGPFISLKAGSGDWIIAVVMVGLSLAMLLPMAWSVPDWHGPAMGASETKTTKQTALQEEAEADQETVVVEHNVSVTEIGLSLVGVRTDLNQEDQESGQLPEGYLLPFEIVSVHLLVILIGAAYLARAKRPRKPTKYP
ncbi:NADH-quinone oxidoreductase subunit J [Planctomycetales bacterium 10988]|nr:NADH-quinone oxidoreductase subunit J [Planctomycetales bacterium 10988]